MKKIIVIILLLIPLIVLLTISASGMIISAEVSISIESLELWHKGEPIKEATINYGEYTKNKMRFQLIPRYFPSVANVSGFKWYSDNTSVATVDDGIVTFHGCGFAKITAQSTDVSAVRASCSFIVEDDTIHSMELTSYDTEQAVKSISLCQYEESMYRLNITPYIALVGDPSYSSSNKSVFTVSDSGLVVATGVGDATLTVTAKDKKNKEKRITIPVKVQEGTLVKRSHVWSYDLDLDLSPYIASGSVAGGNVVSLTGVAEGESRTFTVSDGNKSESITVTRLDYQKKIGIDHLDLMQNTAWKDGAYVALGRTMTLQPIDLAGSEILSDVTIRSDNTSVLSVENGKLCGRKTGAATLTFEKEGYQSFSLDVTVAEPISFFSLNFDSDNDVIGVGSQRVYGTKSIYDNDIVSGIRVIPEGIYPKTGTINRFTYSVEESYASVDQTGLVTFSDEAIGKPVTVTVKSVFSSNGMTRKYVFNNVVKGINIGFGYGVNPCDVKAGIKPSFKPYYQALKTMDEDRDYALIFQTNVYVPTLAEIDAIKEGAHKISFIRDIYGNGYKIDGQFFQYEYSSRIFNEGKDDQLVGHDDQKGITVSDLFVNSYAPLGNDSKETFDLLMTKGGVPIRTYYIKRPDFSITFRYCVFQYAYTHAITIGGTIVFDGCVFRNSAGVAVMVESIQQQENYMTINNCIFSNSLSMAGLVSNGTFPYNPKEQVHYNAIKWTGNNYIYNWKKIDEIRMDIIPKGVMKNDLLDRVLDKMNDKLTECMHITMRQRDNAGLVVKYGGEEYVNMGFLFINFWSPDKIIINDHRESITDGMLVEYDTARSSLSKIMLDTRALGYLEKPASAYMTFDNPSYMLNDRKSDGSYLTAPEETYKLDEKTYARLRGQGD